MNELFNQGSDIEIVDFKEILSGKSKAKKYYLKTNKGVEMLTKITPTTNAKALTTRLENKRQRAEAIAESGVPLSRLIKIEPFGKNTVAHFYEWCKGQTVYHLLKNGELTEDEAYDLGARTGEFLRQIHSIPLRSEEWDTGLDEEVEVYNQIKKRLDNSYDKYRELRHKLPVIECLLPFFKDKGVEFLRGRKLCYAHRDYHSGNIMYDVKSKQIGLIDYSFKPGDAISDLAYVYDSTKHGGLFHPYAKGQVDGYLALLKKDAEHSNDATILLKTLREDFVFFFAAKILTLFTKNHDNGTLTQKKLESVKSIQIRVLKWLDNYFGLDDFEFTEEILEAVRK
ncbi:MAG: aminoglycoside phosphotransferase family protein [Oscillospiraceae bacterium]|nr:aminoglycoside phosphotransferase family protein [Oscillospiraceae bacterium]